MLRSDAERLAAALEDVGKAMDGAGVGQHPVGLYASTGDSAMQGQVIHALAACGLESLGPTESLTLEAFDESARASGASMESRFLAKQMLAKQGRLTS
jgi:hypothetical protein